MAKPGLDSTRVAAITAALCFAAANVWIWAILECVPIQTTAGGDSFVECDPLPTLTRMLMTSIALPLALGLGFGAGMLSRRMTRAGSPK